MRARRAARGVHTTSLSDHHDTHTLKQRTREREEGNTSSCEERQSRGSSNLPVFLNRVITVYVKSVSSRQSTRTASNERNNERLALNIYEEIPKILASQKS
jgi:hypothetical protein